MTRYDNMGILGMVPSRNGSWVMYSEVQRASEARKDLNAVIRDVKEENKRLKDLVAKFVREDAQRGMKKHKEATDHA